ncbi:MAG: hypothetical protein COC12_06125 [Rhodobacteraceae bacterium]|nr:MAG: hypothetical protein COC12_06125 [Paracoccaceae bacterium]
MAGAVAALLGDGSRLHLQHGPIDLVIGVDAGSPGARQRGFERAARRFDTILSELVTELPLLRRAIGADTPDGEVARRMDRAVRPHARDVFVTPMAAVAGAVADEVLGALTGPDVTRAYVNNGGDIALFLGAGTTYTAAIAGLDGADQGRVTIDAASPARGIATSGQGGRSLSFGIADSVTVLARNAAQADVAATLIANAVDLAGHPAIIRTPACVIDPDSDLGARAVVSHVGPLCAGDVDAALAHGAKVAQVMLGRGQILGAALFLNRGQRIIGEMAQDNDTLTRMVQHA